MIGAVINASAIVAGGIAALAVKKPIPQQYQKSLKITIGVIIVFFGLHLTWISLNGTFWQVARLLFIVLLAMAVGKLVGKLLHLQKLSNSIGRFATAKMQSGQRNFDDGFVVASALFCVGPLSILASLDEGLTGIFSRIFLAKALMDGLTTMAFVTRFGWSPLLAALPVLAWQGSIIRGAVWAVPFLSHQPQPLLDAITATDGLLIFSVALIILELKRVEIADYLPSLVVAPLLTRFFWPA